MTEKANPSINRPAEAYKTAGSIAYGGHGDGGFVVDGASPTDISTQDSGIDETLLESFSESHGVEYDVSGEDSGVSGIVFNDDGTLMYIAGFTTEAIYEYSLSTAYDITTATLNDSLDLSASLSTPDATGVNFNSDGTKMFVTDAANSQIAEYALSTAYDVSTASLNDTTDVSADDGNPQGIQFNNDGTLMYIIGSGTASIYEYSLSTAYDASTLTLNDSLDLSSRDSSPLDLLVTDSGNRLYVVGSGNDILYQYSLGTVYDISTATFEESYGLSSPSDNPTGVAQFGSGENFVVSDSNAASLFTYPLRVNWNVSTAVYQDAIIEAGEAFVFGSWLAKDTRTEVDLSASTSGQTVYVGWNKSGTNDVIVGLPSAFSEASGDTDEKIPLWTFDTDGSGVSSVTDERDIGQTSDLERLILSGRQIDSDEDGVLENSDVDGFANFSDGDAFNQYPIQPADIDRVQKVITDPHPLPIVALEDAESYEITMTVEDGESLTLYLANAYIIDESATGGITKDSNLTAEAVDSGGTVQYSSSGRNKDSTGLVTITNNSGGPEVYKLRISNNTGTTIDTPGASGAFGWVVQ